MPINTGVNVSKAVAYAALDLKRVSVSKAVAYAALVEPRVSVSKAVAYALLDIGIPATTGQRGNIDYDQIGLDARHGQTGTKIQYSDNTGATNHLAAFDANGNLTDSGVSSAGVGSGSVTSVGLSMPSDFTVGGSPVTSSGTLAVTANTQTANTVKAGPSSGSAAAPTYRALVGADLPVATTGAFGAVKPDGTTITIASGVISAAGGGGGYNAGTVPAVVQVAYVVNGGNSVTFGAAPTNGNLLVAMSFNPTSNTPGTGWTKQVEQPNGTDWGDILTKVAGVGESATQSPMSGVSTTGAIIVWELNGQNATSPFVYGISQTEQAGPISTPLYLSNFKNCIGLAAIAVVSTPTITSALNLGVQDVLDNTGTRRLAAGHTNLSVTPQVGVFALFSSSASSKAATCLITS